MKTLITFLFTLFLVQGNLNAQAKEATKFPGTPFQGTKEYCDFLKPLRFTVLIKGNAVIITKFYNKEKPVTIKGSFKKGKLSTNDPTEKQYRADAKYYKIYPGREAYNETLLNSDFNRTKSPNSLVSFTASSIANLRAASTTAGFGRRRQRSPSRR